MDTEISKVWTKFRETMSLISGLFIGALAGLGTMLLFAPQSGKKTRALLRVKSDELQDQASDSYTTLVKRFQINRHEILAESYGKSELK